MSDGPLRPAARYLPLLLLFAGCAATGGEKASDNDIQDTDRRQALIRRIALDPARNFQFVTARLVTGIDTALAWRQLDTLLTTPTGDMFWMYPATGFYFHCRNLLPPEVKRRFRETWGRYTPYRGDTENHFVMYYSSLLLFSQEWPEMTREEWFNGKSSAENYAEAKEFLEHWIDETSRYGCTEWDSPRYLYYYLTPILLVRDFAADPLLRRRFQMMLECQLADLATEYLNGCYTGAHSRDADASVIDPRRAEVGAFTQLYFEEGEVRPLPDMVFAALSDFECPQIIREIAHARGDAYVQHETRRSRAKMRYSDERFTPVRKYTYMTSAYALGSMEGGIQQPIQQHTWDVTFAADRPNNTVFSINPHASARELGTFFPEEPELMLKSVVQAKASYVSPDKWVGGSPFERVYQWKNYLVATYNTQPTGDFSHVDLFIPNSLDLFLPDSTGWMIGRMEDAYFAIYLLNPGPRRWSDEPGGRRLRVNGSSLRCVVQCGSQSDMSFDSFVRRLTDPTGVMLTADEKAFMNEGGATREGEMKGNPETMSPIPQQTYARWLSDVIPLIQATDRRDHMLFDGPYLKSRLGSGVITMRSGTRTRTLDFPASQISEM